MPSLRDFITPFRRLCLALLAAIGIACAPLVPALAQCGVVGSGTTPWPNCTTWTGPSWAVATWSQSGATIQPILAGADFNGDGLGDLIYMGASATTVPPGTLSPTFEIATSTGSSFTTYSPSLPVGVCYQGNFDGSGRAGVGCLSAGSVSYASSNGTGYGSVTTQAISSGNLMGARQIAPKIGSVNPCFVMDVDGDGTDDIVCGYPTYVLAPPNGKAELASSQSWGVYLFTGSGVKYQVWTGPSGGYTQTSGCLVGDFNGDGLKDLACLWGTTIGPSWNMLLSTGSGWEAQVWTNGPEAGDVTSTSSCTNVYGSPGVCQAASTYCMVGDFDGDGVDDIACRNSASNEFSIGFGGGNGGFKAGKTTNWAWPNLVALFNSYLCSVTDIYGTGRDGILCVNATSTTSTSWVYGASTGAGFTVTSFSTSWSLETNLGGNIIGLAADPRSECVFADFNGDGIKDVACNPSGNGTWYMGLSSRPP